MLNDVNHRADLINNIYSNLLEHKFAGVNIDFEQPVRARPPADGWFMEELKAKLSPAGMLLTQAVPADDEAYDLSRLGKIDDYIVPMVYDEHYQVGYTRSGGEHRLVQRTDRPAGEDSSAF